MSKIPWAIYATIVCCMDYIFTSLIMWICVYLEFSADAYVCNITDHSVSERNTISSPKSLRALVCLSTFQIEMVQESSFSVSKETRSCDARVPKAPPTKSQLPTPWKRLHQQINQNEITERLKKKKKKIKTWTGFFQEYITTGPQQNHISNPSADEI